MKNGLLRWVKENGPEYAPIVLRLAMASVFLWFGINQLVDTEYFEGYVPEWAHAIAPVNLIVISNGIFETIFGLLLLTGLFTRVAAVILGLHLLGITFELGYNEIGVRDWGLALGTFAVALYGPDRWTVDNRRKK
jgi:uncharacterized membrane protein YphA (DoxX/SURF4 family)